MDSMQNVKNIISVQDIRTKLADIANDAAAGESFLVVRHSRPIFKIVPLDYDSNRDREEVLSELDAIPDVPSSERDISDDEIVELVREVRREKRGTVLQT